MHRVLSPSHRHAAGDGECVGPISPSSSVLLHSSFWLLLKCWVDHTNRPPGPHIYPIAEKRGRAVDETCRYQMGVPRRLTCGRSPALVDDTVAPLWGRRRTWTGVVHGVEAVHGAPRPTTIHTTRWPCRCYQGRIVPCREEQQEITTFTNKNKN